MSLMNKNTSSQYGLYLLVVIITISLYLTIFLIGLKIIKLAEKNLEINLIRQENYINNILERLNNEIIMQSEHLKLLDFHDN